MVKNKFESDRLEGKKYEECVEWHLLVDGISRKDIRHYGIKNVADDEEYFDKSVDIIETWEDAKGNQKVYHEVKSEKQTLSAPTYYRGIKEFHKEIQTRTMCDDEDMKLGTENLFIETESLLTGNAGWYPRLKAAMADGIERYIWFVLVVESKAIDAYRAGMFEFPDVLEHSSWRNNVLLRVPVPNLISIFEKNVGRYRLKDNRAKTAKGYLMPIADLWKPPVKRGCEYTDIDGKKQILLFDVLHSHPSTGSGARLYFDTSRLSELFLHDEKALAV